MARLLLVLIAALSLLACSNSNNDELKKQVSALQIIQAEQTKAIQDLARQVQELNTRSAAAAQALSPQAMPPIPIAPGAPPNQPVNPVSGEFGFLSIRTTPNALATATVQGKSWAKATPFEDEKFPAGNYSIRVRNEGLGWEKTLDVVVHPGKRAVLENVNLNPRQ